MTPTPFDLNQLSIAEGSDAGAEMKLISKDGSPVIAADGQAAYILVRGMYSEAALDIENDINNSNLEAAKKGRDVISAENNHQSNIRRMVAVTAGWNLPKLDDQDFPYNEANARRFWSDRRFRHILNQGLTFMQQDRNFMKG